MLISQNERRRRFLKAFILAVPSGKQNSFAAQNPPSLVFAIVRTGGPIVVGERIREAVAPTDKQGLIEKSIAELDKYYGRVVKMYGGGGREESAYCMLDEVEIANLKDKKDSVDEVIATVITKAFPGVQRERAPATARGADAKLGHSQPVLERDTGLEPSRSGVLGLLCAALGVRRGTTRS